MWYCRLIAALVINNYKNKIFILNWWMFSSDSERQQFTNQCGRYPAANSEQYQKGSSQCYTELQRNGEFKERPGQPQHKSKSILICRIFRNFMESRKSKKLRYLIWTMIIIYMHMKSWINYNCALHTLNELQIIKICYR